MRPQRRTTIIVVGGALAIASVGYGLGSQAGDGTAIADNAATEQDGGTTDRAAPPGLSRLASKLGVDTAELGTALRGCHEQQEANRRDDFTAKLAQALGISTDRVKSAFDGLRARHEERFAARLADALGVETAKVKAALDKLEGRPPGPPDQVAQKLAGELGLDASDVQAALMKIRPFDGPGAGPGPRHHDRAMPLRRLARSLGVSRPDLRKAFVQLRAGAENDWKQEQQALAKFLAGRFNLDVSKVQDALAAMAPPLRSPHPPGPRDHPPAI